LFSNRAARQLAALGSLLGQQNGKFRKSGRMPVHRAIFILKIAELFRNLAFCELPRSPENGKPTKILAPTDRYPY
jgi:hypothetical protein